MHCCGPAPTQRAAQWQPVPFIGKVIRRSGDYATSSGDSGAAASAHRGTARSAVSIYIRPIHKRDWWCPEWSGAAGLNKRALRNVDTL